MEGQNNCIFRQDDRIVRVSKKTIPSDILKNEIDICSAIESIDPEERRFLVPYGFQKLSLSEYREKNPVEFAEFGSCMRGDGIYAIPSFVIRSFMTAAESRPETFTPFEKNYLRESILILQDNDIAHNDIHPGNILMLHGRPVIIDWELATFSTESNDMAMLNEAFSIMEDIRNKPKRQKRERSRSPSPGVIRSSLFGGKTCGPNHIRNPVSGRCVKISGKLGRKI